MKHKQTYDDAKQTYLNHSTDREVIRKLSPAHILGIKKLEIEERKLQLATDSLKSAVLGILMGGKIIEGEVVENEKLESGVTQGVPEGSDKEQE